MVVFGGGGGLYSRESRGSAQHATRATPAEVVVVVVVLIRSRGGSALRTTLAAPIRLSLGQTRGAHCLEWRRRCVALADAGGGDIAVGGAGQTGSAATSAAIGAAAAVKNFE